jgi:integrase
MKVTRKYKHIRHDKKTGCIYLRLPDNIRPPHFPKSLRLREEPGTPEWDEVYDRALAGILPGSYRTAPIGPATPRNGSLEWLCTVYVSSSHFSRLKPGTRRQRLYHFGWLIRHHGHRLATEIRPKNVRLLLEEKIATSRKGFRHVDGTGAANGLLTAMRTMFSWAVQFEHLKINPAARDQVDKYVATNKLGFKQWSEAEGEQFEAYWPIGTKPRLLYALCRFTAARVGDAARFGPENIQADGTFFFVQEKTGRPLSQPIRPELQEVLDGSEHLFGGGHFLCHNSIRGVVPYTPHHLSNQMTLWAREAGLEGCSAHGLRKAFTAHAAEEGYTTKEIQSWTGHVSLKEIERYTFLADQKRMAKRSLDRELQSRKLSHSNVVPLKTGTKDA